MQKLLLKSWFLAMLPQEGNDTLLMLLLQKDKASGAVVRTIFGQLSPKLLASVNFMYVYACTGQGKAAMKDHATARTCLRLAVRDKDYLFTAADSAKFSSMIVMSEVASQPLVTHAMHETWSVPQNGQTPHALLAVMDVSVLYCMSSLAWSLRPGLSRQTCAGLQRI